jgi:hypothetical protein
MDTWLEAGYGQIRIFFIIPSSGFAEKTMNLEEGTNKSTSRGNKSVMKR